MPRRPAAVEAADISWWTPEEPRPIVYERAGRLSEAQIIRALAAEVGGVPTFEAVLQLIDDHEDACAKTAIGLVSDHGALASEVGGIQVLRELRITLLELRARGREGEDDE